MVEGVIVFFELGLVGGGGGGGGGADPQFNRPFGPIFATGWSLTELLIYCLLRMNLLYKGNESIKLIFP